MLGSCLSIILVYFVSRAGAADDRIVPVQSVQPREDVVVQVTKLLGLDELDTIYATDIVPTGRFVEGEFGEFEEIFQAVEEIRDYWVSAVAVSLQEASDRQTYEWLRRVLQTRTVDALVLRNLYAKMVEGKHYGRAFMEQLAEAVIVARGKILDLVSDGINETTAKQAAHLYGMMVSFVQAAHLNHLAIRQNAKPAQKALMAVSRFRLGRAIVERLPLALPATTTTALSVSVRQRNLPATASSAASVSVRQRNLPAVMRMFSEELAQAPRDDLEYFYFLLTGAPIVHPTHLVSALRRQLTGFAECERWLAGQRS